MNEVEEIKSRLGVAEVLGGYLELKQSGRNLKANCPFHHEKTASFMVSPDKDIWHCFGCHQGGDIFKFVMQIEGQDFRQALEMLAERAGVELKASASSKQDSRLKERLLEANSWAAKYFQESLVRNAKALEYVVKRRRINKQSIKDFQIGYAPDSWDGLTSFLKKKGFSEAEIVQAGLASKRNGKSGIYDMFRGRVVFAICDAQGRPVGFTGRALDDSLPKYLNTPQTVLYDKSRAIFGLHLAKEAIRVRDEAILVEGNVDVVISHQAGVKNVVATSGTALTAQQLKALGRFTKNIKLAFDQDAAGLSAAERAIETGQSLGLNLKVIQIVGAKDPDELIAKDPVLWQKAIVDAKYVIDYLFDRLEKEYDITSVSGKKQYSDRLSASLRRLADSVEQNHYVQLLAGKLGVESEAIKEKLAKEPDAQKAYTKPTAPKQSLTAAKEKKTGKTVIEETLLAITLVHPDARLALDDLEPEDFDTPELKSIFESLRVGDKTSEQIALGLPLVSDYVKILTFKGEEEYASLSPTDCSFEAFTLARRLKILAGKKSKSELTRQLREAERAGDAMLVRSLIDQYQALIKEEL